MEFSIAAGNAAITQNDIDIVVTAHASRRVAFARIHPALRPIVLWRGPDFDAAGDFTLSQAHARAQQVLADMAAAGTLQSLAGSHGASQ